MSNELDMMAMLDSVDLSKVETSFPLLASGVVTCQVSAIDFKRDTEKKADAKPYLMVELTLVSPWKTVPRDGEPSKPVNPGDRGCKLVDRIYFGDYEDKKTGEAKKFGYDRMATLRESAFGKATEGARFSSIPQEMLGQTIQVELKFEAAPVNKDTKEVYGPRTSVARYIKAKR